MKPSKLTTKPSRSIHDVTAWYNKGNSLRSQDKYDEAIKAYDSVIESEPKFAKAWHNKYPVFELLGRASEFNAAYAKAKELGHP
jgi:tetratricopeptide (TPR) repeat protein